MCKHRRPVQTGVSRRAVRPVSEGGHRGPRGRPPGPASPGIRPGASEGWTCGGGRRAARGPGWGAGAGRLGRGPRAPGVRRAPRDAGAAPRSAAEEGLRATASAEGAARGRLRAPPRPRTPPPPAPPAAAAPFFSAPGGAESAARGPSVRPSVLAVSCPAALQRSPEAGASERPRGPAAAAAAAAAAARPNPQGEASACGPSRARERPRVRP
ncbi:spidroin-2-like [Mustela erminea]|uniref:spidroin-2-like n=1 Tax=Mustela erminea TaxID=36723 RepID=UPI001386D34F|nr:spidroin-2-like [Mustela erminea]